MVFLSGGGGGTPAPTPSTPAAAGGATTWQDVVGQVKPDGATPGPTSSSAANQLTKILPLPITLRPGGASGGVGGYDSGNQTFTTLEEAVSAFYMMDDSLREDTMHKMWYYGLLDGPNNEEKAADVWARAVAMAANYGANGTVVTVPDMFARMTNLKAGQLDPDAPRTTTQKMFNMLDPEQAKVWIRSAFQTSMGRDPHDAEMRQLIGTLQSAFKANPKVMQTTTGADGSTTQRVTDPGFGEDAAQASIINQLADDPEARASQAAATYYGALERALSSHP